MQALAHARNHFISLEQPHAVIVPADGVHDDIEQGAQATVARHQAFNLSHRQIVRGRDRLFEGERSCVPDEQSEQLLRNDALELVGVEVHEHPVAVDHGLQPEDRLGARHNRQRITIPGHLESVFVQPVDDPTDVVVPPGARRERQRVLERTVPARESFFQTRSRVCGVDRLRPTDLFVSKTKQFGFGRDAGCGVRFERSVL